MIDREGTKRTISQAWEGIRGLAWRPDGREVWYTAAHAGVQYAIQGSASSPSDERLIYAAPGGVLLQDISRDGKVVITRYDRSMQIEASLDGADARGISWLDFQWARDITPDSRRILVTYSGQGSSPNTTSMSTPSASPTELGSAKDSPSSFLRMALPSWWSLMARRPS